MLIKNASILRGKELDFIKNIKIRIQDDKFQKIQSNIKPYKNEECIDCEGLLLIPGLINCHTHIGDSIAKDVILNNSVDEKIHPIFGAKSKILKNTNPQHITTFMKHSCQSMIRKGITTFVDFREGGLDGVMLLKNALKKMPIRSIILGRLDYYQNSQEIKKNIEFPKHKVKELLKLLETCDGLGISGANEHSNCVLDYYSKSKKLRAIHSSETSQSISRSKKMTRKSETSRALHLKPHFLVHMTYASTMDLRAAVKQVRGIVVCPRANASLAEGIPDVQLMKKYGYVIALGTDNVMINSPDIFREMDFLWKTMMGIHKKRIDPKEILKMATVNAGKILRKDIGVIETKKTADCIFIDKHSLDLEPMHSPHAALVHRASDVSIRAVMIGGKIVYGKI